ncbi:MAG: DUF5010 domain-containing protein, partial [Candidatus Verstraetearchaeota archaeon]|nr:DUF5010 domain-containing protein [Candidatus Verstraetearchaeota archaeon]
PKLPRKPEMFKAMVLTALKYSTTRAGEKIIKIDTYNEFGEATGIEPTREEGFAYLEVLRSILMNLTKDTSPPIITSLNWTPTRVVLDKVYDINVSFTAIDDENPIAYAELHFVPVEYYYMVEKYGMRPEDYPKVFPPDKERVFVLTPVDGKFDSLKEEFSVQIRDIVGGREYKIVALVKDLAGNEKIVEVKTPYIRQFENLGKELYDKGIIVGGSYYLWWGPEYWSHNSPLTMKPLMGWYDSTDQIVISKHIDIFTGHGINVFFISWSGKYDENTYYNDKRLKDVFLQNPLISNVKFAILYETHGRLIRDNDGLIDLNNPINKEIFVSDFEYLAKTYFSHPSYLRIKDKPVVYIYDTPVFTLKTENISEILNMVRNSVRNAAGKEMYIISSEVNKWFDPKETTTKQRLSLFDCNSDWAAQYGGNPDIDKSFMDNYDENVFNVYKMYTTILTELGKDFMPSIIPGFRDTRIETYKNPHIVVERDIERFIKRMTDALSTTHKDLVLIRFDTLNDFHENTQIEPTVTEDYKFLNAIADILRNFLRSYK